MSSPTPASAAPILPVALLDWKRGHRPLAYDGREAVASYLTAIIKRDPEMRQANLDHQYAFAITLWRRFRERYDELNHSDREDLIRAMRAI